MTIEEVALQFDGHEAYRGQVRVSSLRKHDKLTLVGVSLVDTLMNLPFLAWAAGQTGDDLLLETAHRHAAMPLRHQLRDDGSLYHVFRFDPANGTPLGGDTYQGASPDSAWTRGQAWAFTGLAILGLILFFRSLSGESVVPSS